MVRLEYGNGNGNKTLLGCVVFKYDPALVEEEDLKAVRLLIDRYHRATGPRLPQQSAAIDHKPTA